MVRKVMTLTGAVVVLGLLALEPAWAGFMRCGSHTIEDGGRHGVGMYEVLKKCGQPTARFGNNWIYDRGGSKKIVTFNDSGRISSIKDG